MPNLTFTQVLVRELFQGKTDSQGVPMFEHMARVAEGVKDEDRDTQHIAWLHDLVEDTKATLEDLVNLGYSKEVIDAVYLLTHDKKELTYAEYIDRLCASGDRRAIRVKISDQRDNLNPKRWSGMNPHMARNLAKKWNGVLNKLVEAEGRL